MGNWMTVSLRGTLSAADLDAAHEFVHCKDDYSNFHPLCAVQGLAGLGQWAAEEIYADGNLSERGYGTDDIAATLREMVKVAPSLALKVHCGGDYESKECVATVTVADGEVIVGQPEVASVAGVSDVVVKGRLFDLLGGA